MLSHLKNVEDWSGGVVCTLTSASLVCPSGRSHRDHRSPAESNLVFDLASARQFNMKIQLRETIL